jgi:hypothetical protein
MTCERPRGEECQLEKCAFCENLTALSYHAVPICLACFEAREREGKTADYNSSTESKADSDDARREAHKSVGSELARVAEQGDRAIVAFLRAELALGFIYARAAKVEAELGSHRENRTRQLAKDVVETIHWFRDTIADPAIQLELREGAARLEQLLSENPGTQI